MSLLPPPPANPPNDWEDDDMDYTTVPPPPSYYRSCPDKILDQPHQAIFRRAITNVLHTNAAEFTLAQLIDGLPLRKVAHSTKGVHFHECVIEHKTLSPGAMDKAREFRDDFDPCAELDLPVDVLRRYQNIPAGSHASKLPLIELVAVAVHRLAGLMYLQGRFNKERVTLPVAEDRLCHNGASEPYRKYYPTPFCLNEYANPEFPDGMADIAGYWAENWIFGGVVVFSRGESGVECNDVWLHPFREGVTTRNEVWALTEDQLTRLLSFLESEPTSTTTQEETAAAEKDCPLPVRLRSKSNKQVVDADNCIPEHNIYRDRWERKMRYDTRGDWEFGLRGKDCEELRGSSEDERSDLY